MSAFAVDLRRTIAAPRERVFAAWLEPATLRRWLHPDGWLMEGVDVEPRVGGRHVVRLRSPDGEPGGFDSVIRELEPHDRIVLAFAFVGSDPREREESLLTLTFRDAPGGGTDLQLVQERISPAPRLDHRSVTTGWTQALARLAALHDPPHPPEGGRT